MSTSKNIVCALTVTEKNRRNLFVYYLPITYRWTIKVMSRDKSEKGHKLQMTDENGDPLYLDKIDRNCPLLCHSEFWKQRGELSSYSDLQEDFYQVISKRYGAVRGKSESLIKNTNSEQQKRFKRCDGDFYDDVEDKYFDDMPF